MKFYFIDPFKHWGASVFLVLWRAEKNFSVKAKLLFSEVGVKLLARRSNLMIGRSLSAEPRRLDGD